MSPRVAACTPYLAAWLVGCVVNFLWQFTQTPMDFGRALERSYFQGVGFIVFLAVYLKFDYPTIKHGGDT